MVKKIAVLAASFCLPATTFASQNLIDADVEKRIDAIMADMTLEQKVGQMIQAEIKSVTPKEVKKYGLGSVLNGGGSFPNGDKNAEIQDWIALADKYYLASKNQNSSTGIPLIWGTDAVHGHNNVIGATIFPHNIGLGAANDPELMRKIGEITAKEVAATGIDWIFAPTVAVVKDNRWGRTYEGYASTPDIIASYTPEIVEGIQSQGLVATAKHFIGDGATFRGIDQGDTTLSLDQLIDEHGQGYVKAIDSGVLTVMASFNSWHGKKVHGHKQLLTDILKEQMGFNGFVVSDWNGIGQVAGCTNDNCPQAINAGIDMIMVPEDWKALRKNILAQVNSGVISQERIDDATRRILRVKILSGLMDAPKPSERKYAKAYVTKGNESGVVGHAEHREIAREAVRKSLVLLKNNDQVLPLQPNQRVWVTGTAAHDIGQQSGGWTISWQGTGNSNSDFPNGSSIYDGIKTHVHAAGGKAELIENIWNDNLPDAAIVVFGEHPYAEGSGDLFSLHLDKAHQSDIDKLRILQARGVPTIAVFITGRPIWVNPAINAADAFVVAWLPGSEGIGVADVLFADKNGKVQHDFVGRLSFDWPNINLDSKNHALPVASHAFSYGYGLNYSSSNKNLAKLDETLVEFTESMDLAIFDRDTKAPWSLFLGDASDWSQKITSSSGRSKSGSIKISVKDYQVQEDARQITWKGRKGEKAQVFWQSTDPINLKPLHESDGALSVVMRVDKPLKGDAHIRMDCGWPCSSTINVSSLLGSATLNEWQRVSLPVACFAKRNLDLERVNTPFVLEVEGSLQLSLAEVSVIEKPQKESLIDCESNVNLADH